MLKGQTGEPSCGEPRPCSLAGLTWHVLCAERYWLREVGIQPEFRVPAQRDWSLPAFQEAPGGASSEGVAQVEAGRLDVLGDGHRDLRTLGCGFG